MSDTKPKRTARDAGRREIDPDEAVPAAGAPLITPAQPDRAQAVALPKAAPEAIAPPPAPIPTAPPPALPAFEAGVASVDDAWTALSEVQTAFVRGFEQIASEMSGLTRSGIAAASEAALALLAAKTVTEAVEINAGFARRRVDAMIDGSARLSEIGVAALTEASRPMLSQFGGFAARR